MQVSVSNAETLNGAIESALIHHPSIDAAKAGLNASEEDKRNELSGYFPDVSISGTGGRLFGDNSTSRGLSVTRGNGYSYLWEGSLTVSQMLFDGLETPNRIRSASARQQSMDMNFSDIKESLSLKTAQTYIDVMRAHIGLSMLREQEKKVNDYLERIKSSVDEGVSDESEYQQALDVKVILESFITDYKGQISAAEAQYVEITGHFPEGKMSVPEPDLDFILRNISEAIIFAQEKHPLLHSAVFSSEAAMHDIVAERAQILPDVNGEVSYSKTDKADILGGESIDKRAVVRLNWNFEIGGGQLARIRKKKYEHQEAISRVNEIKRRIEQGVRLAYSEMQTAQDQLKHQRKRVELNSKLFETYKIQFEGARINLFQLMQADNQLFNTQLEKISGEYRTLTAQYAVLASLGVLRDSLLLTLAEANLAVEDSDSGIFKGGIFKGGIFKGKSLFSDNIMEHDPPKLSSQ